MIYRIKIVTEKEDQSYADVMIEVLEFPNSKVTLQLADKRSFEAIGTDAFSALRKIRKITETLGIKLLIQGCRPQCWPSGMSASMSNGLKIYERTLAKDKPNILANTFDEASEASIGTLDDQDSFTKQWISVIKNGR